MWYAATVVSTRVRAWPYGGALRAHESTCYYASAWHPYALKRGIHTFLFRYVVQSACTYSQISAVMLIETEDDRLCHFPFIIEVEKRPLLSSYML